MKNLKHFLFLLLTSYSNLNYSMEKDDSFLIVDHGEFENLLTEDQDQFRKCRQLKKLINDMGWDKRNNISHNDRLKELDDLLKSQNIEIDFEILWSAIHAGLDEALKILIQYAKKQNFDFNQRKKESGATLLFLAVSSHKQEAVRILLEEKSDPRIKANNEKSSFDIAKENLDFATRQKACKVANKYSCYHEILEIYKLLNKVSQNVV